ncbi:MAG TPA: 2,3,4,5-tetrahydropyridine-2,6-dicarboxylate N-succinyltransferase [Terriglobia bacterium]|nr:2,3,4,5-tetrahydropyridine-2,6-dicarboxylate N-succinyltransferase [Terriglobia bacterium]
MNLAEKIERVFGLSPDDARREGIPVIEELRRGLSAGEFRAAEKTANGWKTNIWVKRGILLAFRIGVVAERSVPGEFYFFDKDTLPAKALTIASGVRVVPGGSTIRDGAYVARNVICMPPMFINIGAYVDEGSMVDSHALVGSCAQIGKRVHLSAAAQIGGVLEPPGALPVIVEDEAFVGGNCGVYEGVIVQSRAVLAPGVILTGGTTVYDLVRGQTYRKTADTPLIIPSGAVVVPGSRPATGEFAARHQVSVYAPVIVKYRDDKTDAATTLEEGLR